MITEKLQIKIKFAVFVFFFFYPPPRSMAAAPHRKGPPGFDRVRDPAALPLLCREVCPVPPQHVRSLVLPRGTVVTRIAAADGASAAASDPSGGAGCVFLASAGGAVLRWDLPRAPPVPDADYEDDAGGGGGSAAAVHALPGGAPALSTVLNPIANAHTAAPFDASASSLDALSLTESAESHGIRDAAAVQVTALVFLPGSVAGAGTFFFCFVCLFVLCLLFRLSTKKKKKKKKKKKTARAMSVFFFFFGFFFFFFFF
jgi:hypothetical protein